MAVHCSTATSFIDPCQLAFIVNFLINTWVAAAAKTDAGREAATAHHKKIMCIAHLKWKVLMAGFMASEVLIGSLWSAREALYKLKH